MKRELAAAESNKRDFGSLLESAAAEGGKEQLARPSHDRAKIIISIQNKDEAKQFRIYMVLLYCVCSVLLVGEFKCSPFVDNLIMATEHFGCIAVYFMKISDSASDHINDWQLIQLYGYLTFQFKIKFNLWQLYSF